MEDSKSNRLNKETLRYAVGEIIGKYGEGFTAADILNYSTPENSPLHNYLEWDDSKAGRQYRLQQCRMLMHRLVLEEEVGQRSIVSFALDETQERGYWTVETVMTKDELKKAALKQMYKDAESFVKKYESFKELFEIVPRNALETFKEKYLQV